RARQAGNLADRYASFEGGLKPASGCGLGEGTSPQASAWGSYSAGAGGFACGSRAAGGAWPGGRPGPRSGGNEGAAGGGVASRGGGRRGRGVGPMAEEKEFARIGLAEQRVGLGDAARDEIVGAPRPDEPEWADEQRERDHRQGELVRFRGQGAARSTGRRE